MGDQSDERCAQQLVVANQGAQLHNGPSDDACDRLLPHSPDPAETSFVSLSSLPSPFTVQNEHAILVLVNDQAERTDDASWGASLPRVHRLARKAPLADDDDQEMHDVARWYSLDLRSTPRRQNTRNSLRVPMQSQPSLRNHVPPSDRQKPTFGAALRDPFYLMRQRMVEPQQHEALNRIKKAVNKLMGFMFSHLGLFLVVVVYAMLGGIMFPPMEKETEIARRQQLETRTKNMSESLLEIIYNVSLRLLSSTEYHVDGELLHMCALIQQHELDRHAAPSAPDENRRKRSLDTRSQSAATLYAKFAYLWKRKHDAELKKLVEEHISTFKREVYTATVNGWDGETIDKQTQWTFAGSTLYSITVITTIGFGDYVPGTTLKQQEEDSQGKLVLCCLYLIFGLGMMSMTIQLMQDSVKESFIAAAQKLGIFERKDNSITAQTKEKNIVPPT